MPHPNLRSVILPIAALFVMTTAAEAQTSTSSMTVTATVVASCTVTAGPLAFGMYTSVSAVDATATILASCTNGTPYTIGLDAGLGTGATVSSRRMSGPGADLLTYVLYSNAGRTTVWGNTIGTDTVAGTGNGLTNAHVVYGRILASQYVATGGYSDTVTVTISY